MKMPQIEKHPSKSHSKPSKWLLIGDRFKMNWLILEYIIYYEISRKFYIFYARENYHFVPEIPENGRIGIGGHPNRTAEVVSVVPLTKRLKWYRWSP